MDELDSLLADLSEPTIPIQKPTPKTDELDDLDALLNDLAAGPTPPSSDLPPKTTTSTPTPSSNNFDDLDSLMQSLTTDVPKTAQTSQPTTTKTTRTPAGENNIKSSNEISSLLDNQLESLLNQEIQTNKLSSPSTSSAATNQSQPPSTMEGRYICDVCQQVINGSIIQALNKNFHPEHFCCLRCKKPLGTSNFFEQEGGTAACEDCFKNYLIPRCAHCHETITEQCVAAINQQWHVHHFICQICSSPFPSGNFFEHESKPYCEACYFNNFGSKCVTCGKPILGECVNVLNQQWHPEHFWCSSCKQPFANGIFFEKVGKPYCEKCANAP